MAILNLKMSNRDVLGRQQAILAGIPYVVTKQFPWKLHEMLEQAELNGDDAIVSWMPSGQAFRVHRPQEFVDKIMKKHFQQNKYKSFQRQLNLWGFDRNPKKSPKEAGSYFHPLFIRGRKELCQEMCRQNKKGSASSFPPLVVSGTDTKSVSSSEDQALTGPTNLVDTVTTTCSSPNVDASSFAGIPHRNDSGAGLQESTHKTRIEELLASNVSLSSPGLSLIPTNNLFFPTANAVATSNTLSWSGVPPAGIAAAPGLSGQASGVVPGAGLHSALPLALQGSDLSSILASGQQLLGPSSVLGGIGRSAPSAVADESLTAERGTGRVSFPTSLLGATSLTPNLFLGAGSETNRLTNELLLQAKIARAAAVEAANHAHLTGASARSLLASQAMVSQPTYQNFATSASAAQLLPGTGGESQQYLLSQILQNRLASLGQQQRQNQRVQDQQKPDEIP